MRLIPICRWVCVLLFFATVAVSGDGHAQVPSSSRSSEAVRRVGPALEKELARKKLRLGAPLFIRIFKESKELEVWLEKEGRFELFKTYKIFNYGFGGLGPKLEKGDGKAPEGFYHAPPRAMNPHSKYHLAFNIGYPNAFDRARERTGSAIMVHGGRLSIGCFAMTDAKIEEIYCLAEAAFKSGQPFFRIHIFPFRMVPENMERHRRSKWFDFWTNLKSGYDYFENRGHVPPNVEVSRGRYIFE